MILECELRGSAGASGSGISINLDKTQGVIPDIIISNGYAFAFDTISDQGHPVYVLRRAYVYSPDDLPPSKYLLPDGTTMEAAE